MKNKIKSLFLKRQRESKIRKNYYFGAYLPMIEGTFSVRARPNKFGYN